MNPSNRIKTFLERRWFLCILVLYILPFFVQYQYTEQNRIESIYLGLPIMQTGDEPHYYITLYSLINDHDIFLTNNYNNALYNDGPDLGTKKFELYDRHTRLFDTENRTVTNIPFQNKTEINLSFIPQEQSSIKEIPGHALGLPLFASLFLWPLQSTLVLEHFAIFLTLIMSLLGIFMFYHILLFYHEKRKAILFTIVFACATQYWYYAKTFWAEPYLASFVIISWYFITIKKSNVGYFFSGLLLGFGFLMKYPFLLCILPFVLLCINNFLIERRVASLIAFFLPLTLLGIIALSINFYFTAHFFEFNQQDAVHFVLPFYGMMKWLFSPTFGLLLFSPILALSVFGVKNFWKREKATCSAAIMIIIFYFLFWTTYIVSQNGGGGYSARYLVPLLPLFVLFCSFSGLEEQQNLTASKIFYILAIVSFIINFFAAFAYPAFTGYALHHTVEKLILFISNIFW